MEFNIVAIRVVSVYKTIKLDIVFILNWTVIISIVSKSTDSVDTSSVSIWGHKSASMIEKSVGLPTEMRIILGRT